MNVRFVLFLILQHHQELLSLAASKITNLKKKDMDDKFIICLNKVSKHFPPFMDRWVCSSTLCLMLFPCKISNFINHCILLYINCLWPNPNLSAALFLIFQVCQPCVLPPAKDAWHLKNSLFGVCAEPSWCHPRHLSAAEDQRLHSNDGQ